MEGKGESKAIKGYQSHWKFSHSWFSQGFAYQINGDVIQQQQIVLQHLFQLGSERKRVCPNVDFVLEASNFDNIFLKIQEFDLEGSENCEFDSLNIYNGPDQVIFLFLPGVDINRDQKNFC